MKAPVTVELTILAAGSCSHLEWVVLRGGGWRPVRFPSLVGVVRHPTRGVILFDTGYSERFFRETRPFPARLYAWTTPVRFAPADGAAAQLAARGIAPGDVRLVLLSHFHADHVGGARDFPNARFVCSEEAWRRLRPLRGLAAVRRAFLPGLLPPDFQDRVEALEGLRQVELPSQFRPFETGADLFGDGSVVLVPLPGHAAGHYGVLLRTGPAPTFLVADACWLSRAYRELLPPHPLVDLILEDPRAYRESLRRLHELHRRNPTVALLPSHCSEVFR